jgi:hypothetical protein
MFTTIWKAMVPRKLKSQQNYLKIKPLGLRLKDNLDKLKINPDSILQNDDDDIPP